MIAAGLFEESEMPGMGFAQFCQWLSPLLRRYGMLPRPLDQDSRSLCTQGDQMSYSHTISRRVFLQGLAAGSAGLLTSALPLSAASKKAVVGFLYVGPRDDFGYNQAHAQGAAAVAKLPGVTMVEEENVPETIAVQKSMASMINLA